MKRLLPKLLRQLRKPVVAGFYLTASFFTFNAENTSAQGCYAFRSASNGKYLTDESYSLRMKPANNQANQIFRLEPVGEYVRITPNGDQYAGRDALTRRWDDAVLPIFLYSGSDSQLWKKTAIVSTPGSYGFIQKGQNLAIGIHNWGDGDPTQPSDLTMTPSSNLETFGANKWFLESKTCPLSAGVCNFNITLSASTTTPNVNANFTLTANCSGGGCSGVTYEWAAQGSETSIYGSPQVVSMPNPGVVDYTVIATKNGCGSRSAHVRVYVQSGGSARMGVEEAVSENETGKELQVYPNPSKGEFNVSFYLEKGEPADLTVTSIAGKTIEKRGVVGKGLHNESFDLAGQPAGMYLFNVIKQNQVEVKKILINK